LLRRGVEVLLLGRRPNRLELEAARLREEIKGAVVHVHAVDLTDPIAVQSAADIARDTLTRVDILVANAGSPAPPGGPDLTSLAESWLATFRGNTLAAVLLTTALDPLITSPGGRIVVIGSAASSRGNSSPSYAASKAALEAWVRVLANLHGPRGITANVVAPGFTEGTELLAGRIDAARREGLVARISLGRPASTDEIAAVVEFLSSAGSSYVTGQTLIADGGLRV